MNLKQLFWKHADFINSLNCTARPVDGERGVRGLVHLDSEPFFIFQRAEYRVRLQNYRGAESDAELSGDEADGRQAAEEQTDGCSGEDALAEEEPEEEILTPNY